MRRIRYTRAAEADLAGIYAYTLTRWGEDQAERYLGDLETACQRIAAGTAVARRLDFRTDPVFRLRQGHHVIVFREELDGAILVIRVLHERMDLPAHLEGG